MPKKQKAKAKPFAKFVKKLDAKRQKKIKIVAKGKIAAIKNKKSVSKKKLVHKVIKKQIAKSKFKKVAPKIVLKGEPCGKCEGCGKVIKIGDNYGRWSDDVLTCAACSPIKHKAHGKSIKPTKTKKETQGAKWLREMAESAKANPPKPNIVKPAGAVKLVRFKRESDTEYRSRVGDAKAQARLTKKGRRLSNKEIAYLMLHHALTAYPEIAALSEMQTAAGHKLRGSRVEKIKLVLRRRTAKMLRPINALLDKRGIINNNEPEEITDAQTQESDTTDTGSGSDTVQQVEATG